MSRDAEANIEITATDKTSKVLKEIGANLKSTGQKFKSLGKSATANITAPIVGALTLATVQASKFEAVMLDVGKNVKGLDASNLESFRSSLLDIGSTSLIGAEGVAALASEGGKLGKNTDEALAFAKAAEEIAVAFDFAKGVEGAKQAGKIIGRLETQLGLTTGEVRALADSINFFGDNTASTSLEITEIFSRQSATIVNSTGLTLKQIAGMSSAFGAVAPNVQTAATGMKNFVSALTLGKKASDPVKFALEDIGFESEELAKRMQTDAAPAIIEVLKSLKGLEDFERAGVIQKLFGKESAGAINPLIANIGILEEAFKNAADESKGLGSVAAEIKRLEESDIGQFQILMSSIKALMVEIGEVVKNIAGDIAGDLTKVISKVRLWLEANKGLAKIGVVMAGIAAAIGPVFVAIGSVLGVLGGLSTALAGVGGITGAVSAGFAALTGPVGIAIAALAAGAFLVVKNWETVKAFFESAITTLIQVFNNWREQNSETITAISESFVVIKDNVLRIFTAVGAFISRTTETVVAKLNEWLEPWGGLEAVAGNAVEFVLDAVGRLADFFGDQFGVIADVLEGQTSVWDGFKQLVQNNMGLVMEILSGIGAEIKAYFATIDLYDVGVVMLKGLLDAFIGFQVLIVKAVYAIGKKIVEALMSIDLVGVGKNLILGLVKGIKDSSSIAVQAAKDLAGKVKGSVTSFFDMNSPSKLFEGIGKFVAQGLAIGIIGGTPLAVSASQELAEESAKAFYERYNDVEATLSDKQRAIDDYTEAPNRPRQGGPSREIDLVADLANQNKELDDFYNKRIALATEKEGALSETVLTLQRKRAEDTRAINGLLVESFGASFDSIVSSTRNFAGEQSGIYKALFAAQKAFAVAQSIVAIQQAIALASANSFPYNLVAMATVAAETASIISTIKGTNLPSFEGGGNTGSGARTGGIDGKGGFPAILHPNETVTDNTRGGMMSAAQPVIVNLTINGDPNPNVVEDIKNAAVSKALETQANLNGRGGSRSRSLTRSI